MNLMIVPGMLVCISFLISVCMLIVSEAFRMSSATVIVRAWGTILPLSMSLLGFGMGTMLANFHMCGIMLVLRAVFNILVRNAGPRGPMCFRYLMFDSSGPCELLFLLCCIASWT